MYTATKNGKSVTWDNGKVTGYRAKALMFYAQRRDGNQIGPIGGPYTTTKHLSDPISAAMLIRDILGERGIEWFGDVPEREEEHDYIMEGEG